MPHRPSLPTLVTLTTALAASLMAPTAHAQFISLGDSHKFIISNTEVARLTSSTRLGIGTQSPSVALEVSGTISGTAATITSMGVGNLAASGNISASGYVRAGFTSTCNSTLTGILRTSGTAIEFCNGTNWVAMGGGGTIPTGAVMAFNLASCPSGWTEYTAARGRFLRGIDNGAGADPSGTRIPGNVQDDALQNMTGSVAAVANGGILSAAQGVFYGEYNTGYIPTGGVSSGYLQVLRFDASRSVRTSSETRPKNVAVLFCEKT